MFRKLLLVGGGLALLTACSSDAPEELALPRTEAAAAQTATDCSGYPSQAAAQTALRENPSDPNNLDPDDDGIACENNPAPFDRTPVSRQAGTASTTTATTEPPTTVTRSTEDMADTGPRDWVGLLTVAGLASIVVGASLRGRRAAGAHWLP